MAFTPDGEHLASADGNILSNLLSFSKPSIPLRDLHHPNAPPLVLSVNDDWVGSIAISSDGNRLASSGKEGPLPAGLWLHAHEGAPGLRLRAHLVEVVTQDGVAALIASPTDAF